MHLPLLSRIYAFFTYYTWGPNVPVGRICSCAEMGGSVEVSLIPLDCFPTAGSCNVNAKATSIFTEELCNAQAALIGQAV